MSVTFIGKQGLDVVTTHPIWKALEGLVDRVDAVNPDFEWIVEGVFENEEFYSFRVTCPELGEYKRIKIDRDKFLWDEKALDHWIGGIGSFIMEVELSKTTRSVLEGNLSDEELEKRREEAKEQINQEIYTSADGSKVVGIRHKARKNQDDDKGKIIIP